MNRLPFCRNKSTSVIGLFENYKKASFRGSITTPEFHCNYVWLLLSQQSRDPPVLFCATCFSFILIPSRTPLIRAASYPRNNFADDNNESRLYAYTWHRTSCNWHKFRAVKLAASFARLPYRKINGFFGCPRKMIREKMRERVVGRNAAYQNNRWSVYKSSFTLRLFENFVR